MPPARPPFLCILDPSLRDFVGHHFAWDHAVAEAARAAGFAPLVLGHRALPAALARDASAIGAYSDDIWASSRAGGPPGRFLDALARNRRFARETLAALPAEGLPDGSILLAHMLTHRQLLGLAQLVESLPRHVTVVALLRYQPLFYADAISARAFARMRRAVADGARLRLTSDSDRLARRIGRLAGLPVTVLPIPHLPDAPPAPPPAGGRPMHLASLGSARDEKGILEIIAAIRLLRAEPEGLAGLRVTLQANDAAPDVAAAIASLAADLPPEVTLVETALDPTAYQALLAEADLLLLPYRRDIYEARTSGVLLEAIGAGRPVICTAGTWMADELALHGAGILVPDHDPAALAAAIRLAREAWPRLRAGAEAGRDACVARHGGAAFMRALLAPPPPPAAEPPKRVQMLYPWPDFLERRAGASLRSSMLAEVVAPHVEEFRVMQPGRDAPQRRGRILVESLSEPRIARRAKILGWWGMRALCLPLTGRAQWGEELFAWLHLERLLDPIFHRRIRRLLVDADAVLLEYGFWAGAVQRQARRLGLPCVLTEHDVIEQRVTGSRLLRRLTAWLETRAARRADAVVTVTTADAAHFARLGIACRVVPNPVDVGAMRLPLPASPRAVLEGLGIALPDRPICLFVGSRHPPNIRAVAALRQVAAAMQATLGEAAPLVVVAGGASPALAEPGFTALGVVPAEALRALYRVASLAVIPLPEGTGASLKTLEAMAAGLPVLGTAVAFRGLAVTTGIEAVVEDDLSAWPRLLPGLLANPGALARLARDGQALAEGYDHRVLMAAYLPLLGIPADAAPVPALPALAGGTLPAG